MIHLLPIPGRQKANVVRANKRTLLFRSIILANVRTRMATTYRLQLCLVDVQRSPLI